MSSEEKKRKDNEEGIQHQTNKDDIYKCRYCDDKKATSIELEHHELGVHGAFSEGCDSSSVSTDSSDIYTSDDKSWKPSYSDNAETISDSTISDENEQNSMG